ncbi:MAG TPA: aquaporin [Nitrososphaeraceae archaeon]
MENPKQVVTATNILKQFSLYVLKMLEEVKWLRDSLKSIRGNEANLGANAPNYTNYSVYVIVGIEILASALLMLVILIVVYTKGAKKFGGIAIGAIVGLNIFLFGLISSASMNPTRSLAPAVVSGYYVDLWLYLTAPSIGTLIVAFLLKSKF